MPKNSEEAWTGRRIDMTSKSAHPEPVEGRIAARKVELGLPDPPRNAGQNRTPSKRALLKAIEEAGGSGEGRV